MKFVLLTIITLLILSGCTSPYIMQAVELPKQPNKLQHLASKWLQPKELQIIAWDKQTGQSSLFIAPIDYSGRNVTYRVGNSEFTVKVVWYNLMDIAK